MSQAWAFVACVVAVRTNLLAHLLRPGTVLEAAERAALPVEFTRGLLDVLTHARIVRAQGDGLRVTDEGMERLLIGGPRTTAFNARLSRALTGASRLRTPNQTSTSPRLDPARELPGTGGDAPLLADVFGVSLVGQLEGLDSLLNRPNARIGCAARDGGRTANALAAQLPSVSVLALGPESDAAALALAWLPIAGLGGSTLTAAVNDAVEALAPGGWIVLACPLAPKRALGAAVARVESVLAGAEPVAADALETLLRDAGCGHIRTLWEDTTIGVRLMAARRPA